MLVTTFLSSFSFYKGNKDLLDINKDNLSSRIMEGAQLITHDFENKFHELEYISNLDSIQSLDWSIQYPALLKEAEFWGFKHIFIMYTNGMSYYAEDNTVRDQSNEPFFKYITGDKRVITEPYVDGAKNLTITTLTVPMKKDGKVIGNICGVVDLHKLNKLVQNINVGENGYAFILNKNGNFVAHNDMNLVMDTISLLDLPKEHAGLAGLKPLVDKNIASETGVDSYTINNETYIISYMPVELSPWTLALVIPKSELLKIAIKL